MVIVTVGIDLAKNVFAVHGVDETGKPELSRPEVSRAKLLELIANLPPCLIGMEACSGAHQWAREFAKFGTPYRLSGQTWQERCCRRRCRSHCRGSDATARGCVQASSVK